MKVKILLNNVDWDVEEQLQAVKDYYAPKIALEFRTTKTSLDIPWDEKEFDYFSRDWALKNIPDDDSDIYVLALKPEDYKRPNSLAFAAFMRLLDKNLIVMGVEPGTKRNRSRGFAKDDHFAGTLRHELSHIFYRINYKKDNTHKFEFEELDFDKILEDIDWDVVLEKERKEEIFLQVPMPDTRKTGYMFGDRTASGLLHPGWDINWGKDGFDDEKYPIKPMYHGEVVYSGRNVPGWGNLVVIEHPELGVWTRYGHMLEHYVKVGERVITKMVMARCGGTSGRPVKYTPHLHFEVITKRLPDWTMYTTGMDFKAMSAIWTDPVKYIKETNQVLANGDWKQKAIEWAKKNNVSNGERPNEEITRVEVMEMIRKYHESFHK